MHLLPSLRLHLLLNSRTCNNSSRRASCPTNHAFDASPDITCADGDDCWSCTGFTVSRSLWHPCECAYNTVAFPRGTQVRGEITSAKGRGRFKGAGVLGITLTDIGGYHVQTSEYVARDKGRGKRTAGFIGGGGGVGALIGGIAGGGKGALIGGLTGAGAGTAAGAMTGSRDVVIPSESAVGFTLETAIRVKGR